MRRVAAYAATAAATVSDAASVRVSADHVAANASLRRGSTKRRSVDTSARSAFADASGGADAPFVPPRTKTLAAKASSRSRGACPFGGAGPPPAAVCEYKPARPSSRMSSDATFDRGTFDRARMGSPRSIDDA